MPSLLLDRNTLLKTNETINSLTEQYLALIDKNQANESQTQKYIQKYLAEVKKCIPLQKPRTSE